MSEEDKWKQEMELNIAHRAHDIETHFGRQSKDSAVSSGQQAMRALIVVNGGAAVAVLAFIGHLIGVKGEGLLSDIATLSSPLLWFAFGVAAASAGTCMSYATNFSVAARSNARSRHYEHPYLRDTALSRGWGLVSYGSLCVAVLMATGSLGCFLVGMFAVRDVLVNLG